MVLVVTVAGALALEVVTLHAAGEALATADGSDVDPLTLDHGVDLDLLADLEAVDRVEAQLDDATTGLDARLGEVAGLRLGELLRILVAKGDLECRVTVAFGGLHLDDAGRLDAEHGDGHDLVVHPHLAHGDFLANDRFQCHIGSLFGQTRFPGHRSYTQMLRRPYGRRSTGFSSCCEVPPSTHFWGRTQTSVGGTPAGVHEDLTLSDLAAPANPLSTQIHLTEALRTRYVR